MPILSQRSTYDFYVPERLIRTYPLPRGTSKMLVSQGNDSIIHSNFSCLNSFLRKGDLLVLNNTKVISARLFACRIKRSHSICEFYCEVFVHYVRKNTMSVLCPKKKNIRIGDTIFFSSSFFCIVEEVGSLFCVLRYQSHDVSLIDLINIYGVLPLPPYILKRRQIEKHDYDNYQCVFSQHFGAVAAPTAGLHFTCDTINNLMHKGIEICFVTLHVSAGTFLPLRCENIEDHVMHEEYFSITHETASRINSAKFSQRRIIAVGTTTVRALESSCVNGIVYPCHCESTSIFIYPSYIFKCVDGIFTNFHFPQSTLFIMICAFIGYTRAMHIYEEAILYNYGFYSYGDCSLLFPTQDV